LIETPAATSFVYNPRFCNYSTESAEMETQNASQKLIRHIERFNSMIGQVAAFGLLPMVLLTLLVVTTRYGFESGRVGMTGFSVSTIALQETVLYLHALLFLLAAPLTLKADAHVRVDVFYRHFSPRTRAWVDLLGSLMLLLPMCVFLIWVSWDFVSFAWKIRERSQESEGLPWVWLAKSLIPVMSGLLGLQGLLEALKNALFLAGFDPPPHAGQVHEEIL
jgi:TRAP-type mannitol/chloroaromatic compound transport system permease small subunit